MVKEIATVGTAVRYGGLPRNDGAGDVFTQVIRVAGPALAKTDKGTSKCESALIEKSVLLERVDGRQGGANPSKPRTLVVDTKLEAI